MPTGKSILITGGTGSFGQAFTEELLKWGDYERICIYSRGEHAQAAMRARFDNDVRLRFFIGDVRDRERLARSMEECSDVVHSAALKRIEVGYYNPLEMKRTNIDGAENVIWAAQETGVEKVVALSTDKAYAPLPKNTYGTSKGSAESLFLCSNNTGNTRFTVTRYGNVWNSAGSVYPVWRALRASGCNTIPVTDPDCTRFFMLMREAVAFVLDALVEMKPDVMIPTLPAYRLGDVAAALGITERMMNITGLPEYEKKHESMCEGRSSDKARRMSIEEIRSHL
jgi:UDP-N-acetylglucosamine 4,6-dehydratase